MLETFEVNKVLIIAPLRVARDTWPAEIEKWDHLKGLDISIIVGDVKTRIAAVHHPAMIYIVNRENIKWLVEYYEKNGMRWDFGMVVIDELSSFKNYQSQRFKFLRKVRPFVKRWVGLTGTPSSNGLMDLWAEIGILDGGERLGKFIGRYREAYFKAGSMNPATGIVFQYVPRQGAEEMIYQRISDITISMKALDYLNMPDCVPTRYEVEMNTQERELYDMLRQDLLIPLKDGDIDAANAASLTGKLLQMSNGAVYDENGKARVIHDHKLEALEDLIEAANGQPVLVAYWFKHDRERIISHLSKLKIKVRDIKSSTDIKDWNAGRTDPSSIGRTRPEHPAGRTHPDLVRIDLVFGIVPADECTSLAAGTDPCGDHSPHHHEKHSRRGCHGCAGAEGHDTGKADICRQSTAGGVGEDYGKEYEQLQISECKGPCRREKAQLQCYGHGPISLQDCTACADRQAEARQ